MKTLICCFVGLWECVFVGLWMCVNMVLWEFCSQRKNTKYTDIISVSFVSSVGFLLSSDSNVGGLAVPLVVNGHGHALVVAVE